MNHLLKSSKIKQSMQAENDSAAEDAREQESLDQIRKDLAKLTAEIKADSAHDQRQTTLEGIMLRVSAELDRIEEMESAEDSEDKVENARMSKMCMDMQSEIDSLKAERLADAHILGGVRADLAKMTVMCDAEKNSGIALCDAEKRARVVAENALAVAKADYERHMQMMMTKDMPQAPVGWKLTPKRDSADNLLYMILTPEVT